MVMENLKENRRHFGKKGIYNSNIFAVRKSARVIRLKLIGNMSNFFEIIPTGIKMLSAMVVEESCKTKECIKSNRKNIAEGLKRSQEEQFETNKLGI
jgi:hypothetical protein